MMSVHRAISVDERRAKKSRTGERYSVGASLGIWVLLIGMTWLGIAGLFTAI